MGQRLKLAIKNHIWKFLKQLQWTKIMKLIDQEFFKNSYHWSFELKWLTVHTQDLNIFFVIVNSIVSLQYKKD